MFMLIESILESFRKLKFSEKQSLAASKMKKLFLQEFRIISII